jgi:hypothetical protein
MEFLNAATILGATSSSESREVGRTAGISSQIRPAATVVAAAMTIAAALTTGPASATARGIDWNAVGRAMGTTLKTEPGDMHTAEFRPPEHRRRIAAR